MRLPHAGIVALFLKACAAEIAAVLTYIRQTWGQTAPPIDVAAVQQVRAATAGRTRAWTPEELATFK